MNHKLFENIHRRLRGLCARADHTDVEAGMTGRKLRPKQAALGQDGPLLRHIEGTGKRRVVLAIDLSGSMLGTWESLGGREIAMALAALHLTGELHVDILLSGSIGWHKLKMGRPAIGVLERAKTVGGAEGLCDTFAANRKYLMAAQSVLVLTDGHLEKREEVNREWRQRGADMIAACPCSPENVAEIQRNASRFFTRAFADADACAVASRAVAYAIRDR